MDKWVLVISNKDKTIEEHLCSNLYVLQQIKTSTSYAGHDAKSVKDPLSTWIPGTFSGDKLLHDCFLGRKLI